MTLNLPPSLFWDSDFTKLDYDRQARAIIARVVMRGSLEDWFEIKRYYGLERIKTEIVQVRYLDKLTLSFCSVYFNIPKEQFRCYNTDPSIQKLWNF
jgi:hypothetical protein